MCYFSLVRTCMMLLYLFLSFCFLQDLVKELKSEVSGHFEDVILALMMTPEEYDAHELRSAMKVRTHVHACTHTVYACVHTIFNVSNLLTFYSA